ncbi:hypothetical protein [uncultured Gimesia sp.]|uniref:hypothetical protein n=1 Tax=uncultured Gimesia sp. TaxID=1678688 RepID=UPI0030DD5F2E|tara:strand:- start:186430 stop:186615 length:186 start_codon:yes stop_codon:yes gene_type:complete
MMKEEQHRIGRQNRPTPHERIGPRDQILIDDNKQPADENRAVEVIKLANPLSGTARAAVGV